MQVQHHMTLKKIAEILDATIISSADDSNVDIQSAFSTDLMSHVLYYHAPNAVLITSLANPQVVQTASIAGIKIIVFTQNKKPAEDTVKLANEKKIPLLLTSLSMYTASGKLFQEGLEGIQNG